MPQVPQVQPTQAVTIKSLMNSDYVQQKFESVLGPKAPGFIASVLAVANSPVLIGAEPKTVISAAMVAATLDLPVNPNLGFAYIVPYNNKGNKQAQFQLGYKGFIQLAQRSGQYKTINATEIREGELVSNNILTGEVSIKALDKDRNKTKVIGYAAYFELANGFSKTLYMSKEDMEAHAKKYSQSYRNDKYNSSLWATQFDIMAKKTVMKLLLSKFGPLTIDSQMQKAIAFDQAVIKTTGSVENADLIIDEEVEYVDNEGDDQPQPKEATDNEKRKAAMEAASELFNEAKK